MLLTDMRCDAATEFQCKYIFHCIPLAKANDGVQNCMDRSDEGLLNLYTAFTTVAIA